MNALKMDPRSFLEAYKVTDLETDPLPLKVLRNPIIKEEIPGQAVHWGFDYLDQKSCPLTLINHLVGKLDHEVRQTDFSACAEATDDSIDSGNDAATRYEPLKLMHAVVKILDDICIKEREDYQDSVDGMVESPDMQPHVFAVSYNNIKNARRFMEDRMAILPRIDRILNLDTPTSYFAVFDGHNGAEAAAFGAAQLHQYLVQSMRQFPDVISSISDAFERLDDTFVEKCKSAKMKSGSTAVLSLIMPGKLYCAWVGDSQAVLVKRTEINNLVTPHKPERTDEIERIRLMGGEVFQMNGTYRVNGNLAVSRAIGDADDKTFIISNPDIKMLELDGSEEFLILACDGLWDEICPDAAALIVRHTVVNDPSNVSAVSQKLIYHAKNNGSTDNISVIVVFLEPVESIRNRYEGVLNQEIDLTVFKKITEPVEQISIEKQIENSMDRNLGLAMELNGHGKDQDQLVDFLSFGSSRESGAQLIGEDGNQFSDDVDVHIKKEVEEDISDGESDDEWQFEKPQNATMINNGLSDNPFGTTGDHSEQAINLLSENPQEPSSETFNPFSAEQEDFEFHGNLIAIQPTSGNNLATVTSDSQDLINNMEDNLIPNTSVTGDPLSDVSDKLSNLNPFHYEGSGETSEHQETSAGGFIQPVGEMIDINQPSGQDISSNPFGIATDEPVMFEKQQTEMNEQVHNLEDGQNAFDNRFTFDRNVEIKEDNFAISENQLINENQIDSKASASLEDQFLAQVESNPIPEDLMEEIERNSAGMFGNENPCGHEAETNPFSAEVHVQDNDNAVNLLANTVGSPINDESLKISADMPGFQTGKFDEPEKYEQELLVDDVSKKASAVSSNQNEVAEAGFEDRIKFNPSPAQDSGSDIQVLVAPNSANAVPSLDLLGNLLANEDAFGRDGGLEGSGIQQESVAQLEFNLSAEMAGGDFQRVYGTDPVVAAPRDNVAVPPEQPSYDAIGLEQNNIEVSQPAQNRPSGIPDAFDANRNVMSPVVSDIIEKVESANTSASVNGVVTPSDLQFPNEPSSTPQEAEQAKVSVAPSSTSTVETKAKSSGATKLKVDNKAPAKTPKSPTKAEAPSPKARTALNTTAPVRKSPTKTNGDAAAKPGVAGAKPTAAARPTVPRTAMQRPIPPKTTGVSAVAGSSSKTTTGRPLTATSRPAPSKVPKDGDGKIPAKPATTAVARARPTTASTSSTAAKQAIGAKPSATSPKRVPPAPGTSTRPPISRPATAGLAAKTDSTSKATTSTSAAAPKPRPRPTPTLSARTATNPESKSVPDSKRLAGPRSTTSATTTKPSATARPPISRPLPPSSARTTAPAKPAGTSSTSTIGARPAPSRAPLKTAEKPSSAATRTTSRVLPPTRTTSATGPKKIDIPNKAKKPTVGASKVDPSIPKKVTKIGAVKTEKAELIEQNGLAPVEPAEGLKELNVLNGINGDVNGETEKQDSVKENGVHNENAVDADIHIAPIDDLLG